jgi:hypothetical protein
VDILTLSLRERVGVRERSREKDGMRENRIAIGKLLPSPFVTFSPKRRKTTCARSTA